MVLLGAKGLNTHLLIGEDFIHKLQLSLQSQLIHELLARKTAFFPPIFPSNRTNSFSQETKMRESEGVAKTF